MDLSIEKNGDATIVRVLTARVIYPLLPTLVAKTREEVEKGARTLVLDLAAVSYIDSATIGCIMDIYRLATDRGGALHILAPQARVETMLSMAGVHKIVPIFREEDEAVRAFGASDGK
ncbi:MAG: STAS domain-containing protein [Vicinamibacteria bacterium]|nr:STAS domain-containing protein [Vicinamibacteria bacterium]MBP9947580.1 STAS domain-containing protein [Vicinamibacteria bacterium]